MSRRLQPKNKEFATVELKTTEEVWTYDQKGKRVLSSEFDYVGKIDLSMPNVLLKANRKDCKTAFIDDFSSLTKKTKSEVVDFFMNNKGRKGGSRRVAYLVAKKKPKAAKGVKKNGKKQ